MNLKILFVVFLILLVMLCAICVCLGAARDLVLQETAAVPSGLGIPILERRLNAGDVDSAVPSSCRDRLRQGALMLLQGDSCTFYIKSSLVRVRTLSLRLTQGNSAHVEFELYGGKRLRAEKILGGGDRVDLQFFEEGGMLRITCSGSGSGCRLEIVE